MGRSIPAPIAAAIVAVAVSSSASAQTVGTQRACPVGDEKVMVEVQEVPNLKQRCYEVVHGKQKGYLCVWAGGTPDGKYGYTRNFDAERVTELGWTGGGNLGCTADDCFNALCAWLVRDHMLEQGRLRFDPEAAADELDEFFKPQPSRQTGR